jgi:MFS family permease
MTDRQRTAYALSVLFAINTMNFFDRQILGAVTELVRREWLLSDGAMGGLGTAFTLLYAAVGVPLGRMTDRSVRTRILSAGIFVWSLLTAASGLAQNYWQLFVMRLGVGVGEASCAPASTSLIGDLFPAMKRAKAMSIFMLGLPIGIALSFAVSGLIAQKYGWRPAFYVAGIPGLICTVAALFIHEPKRGGTETHNIGALRREEAPNRLVERIVVVLIGVTLVVGVYELLTIGASRLVGVGLGTTEAGFFAVLAGGAYLFYRKGIVLWLRPFVRVLSIPTMWWIIASGALHNFNMYAIASFLAPFLMRFHGVNIRDAGLISMVVFGLSGIPGLLIGGVLGDAVMKRRSNGRLLVATLLLLISVPLIYFALGVGKGNTVPFMLLMGIGVGVTYAYYSTVYSSIQDIIEPGSRGTAMALYFFAMYVLGASLGPVGTGLASDYFTAEAASAAGVVDLTREALEPFRAQGLHSAMYIIPVLGVLLTLVLFAGSRTVARDMEKLQRWMRESATESAGVAPAAVVSK